MRRWVRVRVRIRVTVLVGVSDMGMHALAKPRQWSMS